MPLTKLDVLLADPDHPDDETHATTHRMTVLHRDRVAAEALAPAYGILPEQHSQAFLVVLAWNALRRTGIHNEADFGKFRDRVLDFDEVDPEPGEPPADGLADPTVPAPQAGSPSPSSFTGQTAIGSLPMIDS